MESSLISSINNKGIELPELITNLEIPELDPAKALPNEIFIRILSFVGPLEIRVCNQVNKEWNALSNDSNLWKHFYKSYCISNVSYLDNTKIYNYKEIFFKIFPRETGLYPKPMYYETKLINKNSNSFIAGTIKDHLYICDTKEKSFIPFDPESLNFKNSLKIKEDLNNPSHAISLNGCYLAIVNDLSENETQYCIKIYNSYSGEFILSFQINKEEIEGKLNINIINNSIFILTGKEMHRYFINEVNKSCDTLLLLKTNAICIECLSEDTFIFGFEDGTAIIWNNNKGSIIEEIKNNSEKNFSISKINFYAPNILVVKYETKLNEIPNNFDESIISYANFYEISISNTKPLKLNSIKKIYTTWNESNENCVLRNVLMLKNNIIFANYEIPNQVSKINGYSLDKNEFFKIAVIENPDKVISLNWLNGYLYVSFKNQVECYYQQVRFYEFDDFIELILKKVFLQENADENIELVYQFPSSQFKDLKFCHYLNQKGCGKAKNFTQSVLWNLSTTQEKYQALMLYKTHKGVYLNGTEEGRKALEEKLFINWIQK